MVALKVLFALLPLLASMALESNASPVHKREVPQEKSHQTYITATQKSLQLDNPAGIVDPIFGLLGNAAAKAGGGNIANLDCLQQATADQAFTNAKAANDVEGMTAALVYRSIERNTGKVGLKSVICNEVAVNPEIAALSQHQDPASENAAAENKAITLELARQIDSIGGDPLTALDAGTFAPGDVNDPTGAGLTCDTEDCIFLEQKIVPDASEAEIQAAIAGDAGAVNNNGAQVDNNAAQANATEVIDDQAPVATAMAHVAPPPPPAHVAAPQAHEVNAPPAHLMAPPPPAHVAAPPAHEAKAPPPPPAANHLMAPPPPLADHDLANATASVDNTATATATASIDLAANVATVEAPAAHNTAAVNAPAEIEVGNGGIGAGLGDLKDQGKKAKGKGLEKLKELIAAAKAKKLAQQQAGAGEIETGGAAEVVAENQAGAGQVQVAGNAAAGGAGATGIDVGTCTDFSMTFSGGNDGRAADEFTFIPTDRVSFPQASALNPNIIANAMCNNFVNSCGKSAETRDACNVVAADLAAQEASGALGRDQGFADAWLSGLENALGISSAGQGSGGGGAAVIVDAVAAPAVDDANNAADNNNNNDNNNEAATGDDAAVANGGGEIQLFGGALNGKAAPEVVEGAGDRPFSVNGVTFQSAKNAISRSCAVQHNACATAFNSGEGDSDVQACDAQEKECLAAAQVQRVRRSRVFRLKH